MLALGADVLVCALCKPARARGIGEKVRFVKLPTVPALLINPRVPLATADVFRALEFAENPPMADDIPTFEDVRGMIDWLVECRNDLEAPAMKIAPIISELLTYLASLKGARLARMSGSGATCFALFDDVAAAQAAAEIAAREHPDWWVNCCVLGDLSARAMPVVS